MPRRAAKKLEEHGQLQFESPSPVTQPRPPHLPPPTPTPHPAPTPPTFVDALFNLPVPGMIATPEVEHAWTFLG